MSPLQLRSFDLHNRVLLGKCRDSIPLGRTRFFLRSHVSYLLLRFLFLDQWLTDLDIEVIEGTGMLYIFSLKVVGWRDLLWTGLRRFEDERDGNNGIASGADDVDWGSAHKLYDTNLVD